MEPSPVLFANVDSRGEAWSRTQEGRRLELGIVSDIVLGTDAVEALGAGVLAVIKSPEEEIQ